MKLENDSQVLLPPVSAPEISLPEVVRLVYRRKQTLGRSVLIAVGVTAITVFLIPAKYTAEAVILTPHQDQPSLSAVAQLAGFGSGAGLSGLNLLSGFGFRNASDLYVGILKSRTIADKLIEEFKLKQVYHDEDFFTARKHLARNTTINATKDTLIHIRVEDRDPNRAAQLANAYVDELAEQNSRVALTDASQRRSFFENQLEKEKIALATAEVALRNTQESTGLVAPTGQAEGLIRAVSQMHAEILMRQAQVEGMKAYAADDNPHLKMAERELQALQSKLDQLERGKHIPGSPELAAGQLPEAGLEYVRRYRDVKYHEALFEILSKQYEAARLDEAKSSSLVQVIDRAVPPERRSWPPRALLIIAAAILAALAASGWIVFAARPRLGES